MKKILSASIIAAAAMAAPAYAQSDEQAGPYVHLRAGLIDSNNPSLTFVDDATDPDITIDAKARTKSAATFGGEVGYDFGAFRLGVELAYNRHKINGLTFNSVNGEELDAEDFEALLGEGLGLDEETLEALDIDGTTLRGPIAKLRQLAVIANFTYDIPVEGSVQPYVGAGIGGVSNRLSGFGDKDSEFKLAWQLRAGAAFMATENVAITADYTYRQTGKSSYTFDENEAYRFARTKASLFQIGLRAGF